MYSLTEKEKEKEKKTRDYVCMYRKIAIDKLCKLQESLILLLSISYIRQTERERKGKPLKPKIVWISLGGKKETLIA